MDQITFLNSLWLKLRLAYLSYSSAPYSTELINYGTQVNLIANIIDQLSIF